MGNVCTFACVPSLKKHLRYSGDKRRGRECPCLLFLVQLIWSLSAGGSPWDHGLCSIWNQAMIHQDLQTALCSAKYRMVAIFIQLARSGYDKISLDRKLALTGCLSFTKSESSTCLTRLSVPAPDKPGLQKLHLHSLGSMRIGDLAPSCTGMVLNCLFLSFFIFFVFCRFRAASVAYGGSQARSQVRAVANSICHSHRNVESEPCL